MLEFIDGPRAVEVIKNKECSAIFVGIAIDNPKDSEGFKQLVGYFPGIAESFNPPKNEIFEGNAYRFDFEGMIFYFGFVKVIDKYQANLTNMLVSLRVAYRDLRKNKTDNLLVFPFSSRNAKLNDALVLPVLADEMSLSGIKTLFISNEHKDILTIENKEDGRQDINVIPNCWTSNWMWSNEDMLFAFILKETMNVNRGLSMSKSRMLVIYEVVCGSGLIYKDFEWEDGKFGRYTKKFFPKLNGLLNHSIILNLMHFSKENKTDYREGPAIQHLYTVGQELYRANRIQIRKQAEDLMFGLVRWRSEQRKIAEAEKQAGNSNGGGGFQSNSGGGW